MPTSVYRKRIAIGTSLALAVGVLLAIGLSGAFPAAPAPPSAAPVLLATGTSQQWAFGGIASASYSCTSTGCGDGTNVSSLSLHYYVEWVVIYTVTNVSSTQTEVESQAAINASLGLSLAGCESVTTGAPCSSISATANLAGRETALGFTNITNAGSVFLSAGSGAPATVAALALQNAQSSASFNFSGAYNVNVAGYGNAAITFDLGGSEVSSVTFNTPLGVVPVDPSVGQSWNSSSAYTASGSYTSGYSLGESVNGSAVHTYADWQSAVVPSAGTLDVDGTDLGSYLLTDNYTSPPTSVTAQVILITFSTGDFTGSDGWLLLPSGLYSGVDGLTGEVPLLAGPHPDADAATGGNESAYYESGVGFIGGDETASASSVGISGGPQFNLRAGPEPVAVAQQQYSAITAPAGTSSSFPWVWLILAVVVVVVVVVALVAVRRSRRRPPTAVSMGAPSMAYTAPDAPASPGAPTAPSPSPSPEWNRPTSTQVGAVAGTIPVCVSCGQPGTLVPQYGRYYCYHDKRYL